MLNILRKKEVAKKVTWAVAIIIIISFGFLGTAYLLTGQQPIPPAGEVFGKKVTFEDYEYALQQVRVQSILRYGDNFLKIKDQLNLESEAWDRLILLEEAKKRKIKINDDDVIKTIEEYQFFQRDGQFDPLLYEDILQYVFRVKPREFEESIRDTLKLQELFKFETASAEVSEEFVFAAFKKQFEKIQVSYALISPEQLKSEATYTEEQTKQYYEENKFEFLNPPSIKVDYITFPLIQRNEDQEDENTSTKEDLNDKTREKADIVYEDLIVENPDLTAVAKKHGLEIQSSDFFSMEKPDLSLGWSYEALNKIFELDLNEVSDPFESSNAIHIIQLKEKQDASVPEYEDILEKIQNSVLIKNAKEIARRRAAEHLNAIKAEYEKTKLKDFNSAAKILGLEIAQTPSFTRGQYLPKIGISREFQEAAFDLSESNKISPVIETAKGFCILHLDSYTPADQSKFDEQKETIAQNILQEQKNQLFSEYLTNRRIAAKLVDNISRLREQTQ